MNSSTSHILTLGAGIIFGATIVAASCMGINSALHRQVESLADLVTDERLARVEIAAELTAIRTNDSCAGVPIDEKYSVGRVTVLRGDGIIAMVESEAY